jgi:acyl-CoA thioester hydrolase
VYCSWFDIVVNGCLIERRVLDFCPSTAIGFVVETRRQYFAPVAFPDVSHAGLRVASIDQSSEGDRPVPQRRRAGCRVAAQGSFVHVYVDRATRRPIPLPRVWARRWKRSQ